MCAIGDNTGATTLHHLVTPRRPMPPTTPFRWTLIPTEQDIRTSPGYTKAFRWKMNASERQQRWTNVLAVCIYALPLVIPLILASSPLWHVREVMYPQTPAARKVYHSPWVRVPYALLCVVGVVASLLCLPMIGYLVYGGMRSVWGLRTRGDTMATIGYVFRTGMLVGALLVCVMLPLYVTYRYHLSSGDTRKRRQSV